jgi:hypothetical protein
VSEQRNWREGDSEKNKVEGKCGGEIKSERKKGVQKERR